CSSNLILKSLQFKTVNSNNSNKLHYRNYSHHHYHNSRDTREQLYRTLQVKPGCKFEDIREAYRKLCFELHPDINNGTNKLSNLSASEKREKLVKVIKSYKELKVLEQKGLLLREDYIPNTSKFSNFKHYPVYPAGPYYNEANPMQTSHAPVYGSNQLILSWVLAAVGVFSVLQYYRFENSHRSLVEERNRRFAEAEETYRRVRELALSMTSRERIKKFIEDYFSN
ncbi:hypothetical protein CONCODRAFT_77480, partial [Conidiobolus coronatus NRRL 28638]